MGNTIKNVHMLPHRDDILAAFKIHDETIEHLFFDCPVTQIFLKSLSKQLNNITRI